MLCQDPVDPEAAPAAVVDLVADLVEAGTEDPAGLPRLAEEDFCVAVCPYWA